MNQRFEDTPNSSVQMYEMGRFQYVGPKNAANHVAAPYEAPVFIEVADYSRNRVHASCVLLAIQAHQLLLG
jgi:hypothetical protein